MSEGDIIFFNTVDISLLIIPSKTTRYHLVRVYIDEEAVCQLLLTSTIHKLLGTLTGEMKSVDRISENSEISMDEKQPTSCRLRMLHSDHNWKKQAEIYQRISLFI